MSIGDLPGGRKGTTSALEISLVGFSNLGVLPLITKQSLRDDYSGIGIMLRHDIKVIAPMNFDRSFFVCI